MAIIFLCSIKLERALLNFQKASGGKTTTKANAYYAKYVVNMLWLAFESKI